MYLRLLTSAEIKTNPEIAAFLIHPETGEQMDPEEQERFEAPIREQFESQGNPYYSTARLWDDGVIEPADTRRVLGLALAAASLQPLPDPGFGLFRM